MKPRDECIYYLVREMGGLGIRAKDVYFEDMLKHIGQDGLTGMRRLEIKAVVMAADERGRLGELDEAVEVGKGVAQSAKQVLRIFKI